MNISGLLNFFSRATETCSACAAGMRRWLRDPLSHPQLEAMCLTELADLPFDARRFSAEDDGQQM